MTHGFGPDNEVLDQGKSHIYVIEGGGKRKIGMSRQPEKRRSDMQVGSPAILTLERTREVFAAFAAETERCAQDFLKETWSHGEWYNCSKEQAVRAMREAQKLNTKLYNAHIKARQPMVTEWYWTNCKEEMLEAYYRLGFKIPKQYANG